MSYKRKGIGIRLNNENGTIRLSEGSIEGASSSSGSEEHINYLPASTTAAALNGLKNLNLSSALAEEQRKQANYHNGHQNLPAAANNAGSAEPKSTGHYKRRSPPPLPLEPMACLGVGYEKCGKKPKSVFPVHILPYLYLGNDETAKNKDLLDNYNIRYVVNVTSNLPNYFDGSDGFSYLRIAVDDNSAYNLAQFFPQAISFIDRARAEQSSVLVHCWAGISRSVTVCLAYLMYALHCPMEEAFDLLLQRSGTISPNFHFMETLTCWERELFNRNNQLSGRMEKVSNGAPSDGAISLANGYRNISSASRTSASLLNPCKTTPNKAASPDRTNALPPLSPSAKIVPA